MKVRRYRPAYFTVDDEPGDDTQASTLDELLAIPWVQRWSESAGFSRFSVADDRLMAELDLGREWWVVAILDGATDYGLPQWKPVR